MPPPTPSHSSLDEPVERDLRQIERREWQLWGVALTLLVASVAVTVMSSYLLLQSDSSSPDLVRLLTSRGLPGLVVLVGLFCVYVFHTRVTFGRMRRLFEKQAMRDALTGLFNRRYFSERVGNDLLHTEHDKGMFAVLLCDLDHFKKVNDSRGHQTGDDVLKEVGKAILEATRGADLVVRWGGDEILVVLTRTTRDGVLTAADRIRKGVTLVAQQREIPLDVSIGAALYPEHGRTVEELIRLADRALYIAKHGGDKIHIGEEEYRLDDHTVGTVFQPVVDRTTGDILGYEALSRDPAGKVGIGELFRRYQAVGHLHELKCLCLRLQLQAAARLGLQRVFINVDFAVLDHVRVIPKPPHTEVVLEISESEALHDVERHLNTTKTWRAAGYKFAIDDFGAGFISLPFVARLIPDYIKLDRATIVQAGASRQFLTFLRDLILALRNYSKEGIIAEGIETPDELQVVRDLGISPVQGFLVGKPQELHADTLRERRAA
ncbi:MAG TPA: diguanylate cyclase [Nitrospiria bacterium]|nr:diguanylate cyclase [Nitrospiria bacterium]